MKALVYWCRWHEARIRLHGRESGAIWGELEFWREMRLTPFRFDLNRNLLEIEEDGQTVRITIDEQGIEVVNGQDASEIPPNRE